MQFNNEPPECGLQETLDQIANEPPEYGLQETLERIAKLEDEHDLLGVRFAVRKGASIDATDGARYVLKVIGIVIELAQRSDEIRRPEDTEPQHFW